MSQRFVSVVAVLCAASVSAQVCPLESRYLERVASDVRVNGVHFGDANGDGYDDLLLRLLVEDDQVLLSDGAGEFSDPVGSDPPLDLGTDASLLDLNQDGREDVISLVSNSISVRMSNGDGTFAVPTSYGSGFNNIGTIADFNSDSHVDILAQSASLGQLFLYLGDGAGNFAPPIEVPDGPIPSPDLAADINNDGHMDAVFYWSGILVMYGHGDGTFDPPVSLGLPLGFVRCADVDGDGVNDLVHAAVGGDADIVRLFRGLGGGSFGSEEVLDDTRELRTFFLEDVNADGFVDLLLLLDPFVNEQPLLAVCLGDGLGGFSLDGEYGVNSRSVLRYYGLGTGDTNGDSIPEFAFAQQFNGVVLFEGRADGTYRCPTGLGGGPGRVFAGRFNDDAHLDLLKSSADAITLYAGRGDGSFEAPQTVVGAGPERVHVGDLNGDGMDDVFTWVRGELVLTVRLADGVGFGEPVEIATEVALDESIAIADVTSDRRADIVHLAVGAHARVLEGSVETGFTTTGSITTSPTGYYDYVHVSDLNVDGHPDLIMRHPFALSAAIALADGKGGFLPTTYEVLAGAPRSDRATTITDMNNDGLPDLVEILRVNGISLYRVVCSLGRGDGTFEPGIVDPMTIGDGPVVVGDSDGDHRRDVLLDGTELAIRVRRGAGDGSLLPPVELFPVDSPYSVSMDPSLVGEFNGDHVPDIVYWTDAHFLLPSRCSNPCPADWSTTGAAKGEQAYGTPDGRVDLADLLFFVDLWATLYPLKSQVAGAFADLTTTGATADGPGFGVPDGSVNLSDLLFYINQWNEGLSICPG